jgi:hypothetical protein
MVSGFCGRIESEWTARKAKQRWTLFPLADCVAAMLHYTTLVVTAFSFVSARKANLIFSKVILSGPQCEQKRTRAEDRLLACFHEVQRIARTLATFSSLAIRPEHC